jgi:phosphate ABC transporter permease subunit PstA
MSSTRSFLPQGEDFKRNLSQRHLRGRVGQFTFYASLIIAMVALLLLLYTIVRESFGVVAESYTIDPDLLARTYLAEDKAFADLSQEELATIGTQHFSANKARLRTLMAQTLFAIPDGDTNALKATSDTLVKDLFEEGQYPPELGEKKFGNPPLEPEEYQQILALSMDRADLEDFVLLYVSELRIIKSWSLTESALNYEQIEDELVNAQEARANIPTLVEYSVQLVVLSEASNAAATTAAEQVSVEAAYAASQEASSSSQEALTQAEAAAESAEIAARANPDLPEAQEALSLANQALENARASDEAIQQALSVMERVSTATSEADIAAARAAAEAAEAAALEAEMAASLAESSARQSGYVPAIEQGKEALRLAAVARAAADEAQAALEAGNIQQTADATLAAGEATRATAEAVDKITEELRINPLSQAELKFYSWVNLGFLTQPMNSQPQLAGVRIALLGSIWVIALTILMAFPLGIGAAIYLEEYASDNFLNRLIETNISNLAGVPSIVYGILGLAIFVRVLEEITSGSIFGYGNPTTANGRTIISGAMTMALLILPILIINGQEAIRAVPSSLRQASYGLGATKWQTIWNVVLPNALPGILTGTILAVSRGIGETAPLIVVGASTFITSDPTGPFSKFTVIPIQIYRWTSEPQAEFKDVAAAAILVLLIILLSLNSFAIIMRNRFSRGRS